MADLFFSSLNIWKRGKKNPEEVFSPAAVPPPIALTGPSINTKLVLLPYTSFS
jgi:hypothetical protein